MNCEFQLWNIQSKVGCPVSPCKLVPSIIKWGNYYLLDLHLMGIMTVIETFLLGSWEFGNLGTSHGSLQQTQVRIQNSCEKTLWGFQVKTFLSLLFNERLISVLPIPPPPDLSPVTQNIWKSPSVCCIITNQCVVQNLVMTLYYVHNDEMKKMGMYWRKKLKPSDKSRIFLL